MTVPHYSIIDFYPSALKEGEGVGTAYEYYAKAKVFKNLFRQISGPFESMLIAGLPEKYGFSLDFLLLAEGLGIKKVFVQDEREEKIKRYRELAGETAGKFKEFHCVAGHLDTLPQSFDLVVSCEVFQRLDAENQKRYLKSCARAGRNIVIFTPNGGNPSHAELSGLNTVKLNDLKQFAGEMDLKILDSGYIDMPPFPPGITRSQESRDQAQEKVLEKIAMRGIQVWADLEFFLPTGVRRKHSHIVYITSTSPYNSGMI